MELFTSPVTNLVDKTATSVIHKSRRWPPLSQQTHDFLRIHVFVAELLIVYVGIVLAARILQPFPL